jgi:hypothetical protein
MPQGVSFSQVLSDAFKKKPKRPGRPSEKEADRSDGETSEDAGKEKGEEEQIE